MEMLWLLFHDVLLSIFHMILLFQKTNHYHRCPNIHSWSCRWCTFLTNNRNVFGQGSVYCSIVVYLFRIIRNLSIVNRTFCTALLVISSVARLEKLLINTAEPIADNAIRERKKERPFYFSQKRSEVNSSLSSQSERMKSILSFAILLCIKLYLTLQLLLLFVEINFLC